MYLTFGRVFTRVQDAIDCCIQLQPLSYHPSNKYALGHTVDPLHAPIPVLSAPSPLRLLTPLIPASSVQRPVTYCVPTPKLAPPANPDPSIQPPVLPYSKRFQTTACLKPTLKDYPITGSPAVHRITDFDVHRYIGFRHLRDYTALHKVGTGVKIVSQGEPPITPSDLTTIDRNNKGKALALPQQYLEKVGMDIGFSHKDSPGGFKYSLLIVDYKTRHNFIYGL
jgi:hypothetical protein